VTKLFPAPWKLQGNGYIFLYKFPKKFRDDPSFSIPLTDEPFSGFGTVMLVDYHESDAGPYRELLFIPGEFKYLYKKFYSVTKIYVSTMESVINGRKNWGIPKEHADFKIISLGKNRERIIVSKDGVPFFDVTLKKKAFNFRISTRYISNALVQKVDESENIYFTQFNGRGRGRIAKLESISCNEEFFPKICSQRPIAVTAVEDFNIEFPVSFILEKASQHQK